MAPARGARAQVRGQAPRLPRDHQDRDPRGAREPARHRHGPGRGAGDAPPGRSPLRLHGLAAALEEGQAEAQRRPRAVGRRAADRRARARAHALRARRLLEPRRCDVGRRATDRVPGEPAHRRRQARRQRPRLRAGDRQAQGRRQAARRRRGRRALRGDREAARRGAAGQAGRGHQGRPEALHRAPLPAVHDVHAAAGGRAQAALRRAAHDARRAAPLRERLHHLHAHGLDDAVVAGRRRRARADRPRVRRRVPARRAAHLRHQGQERAGGPRGDPPRRQRVHAPERPVGRHGRRRAQGLRADLAPHRRVPDEGRQGPTHDDDAGHADAGPRRGALHGDRQDRGLRRLPARLRRGPRRGRRRRGRQGRRRARAAQPAGGPDRRRQGARGVGPHHAAAGAHHRGGPDQGARGARHRPPVHLRRDHRDDRAPAVRLEEGLGAGADLHRVRRRRSARAVPRLAGGLHVHRQDGGRPRRDQQRPRGAH